MPTTTLAVKYRPHTWDDVSEQANIKTILQQQLSDGSIKNAYLFCGGAGTGKTTCARIFANAVNNNAGTPIEIDAASNSSVEDVRTIIQQAKTQSLNSEYKVFILDECHSFSSTGWQAFLKLLEEPPKKSIFIFCTTDPQKIPKTILSRVQRYDFQRISHDGIVSRLKYICISEVNDDTGIMCHYDEDAIDYIAKIADGGMRDAITLMDKCLSYNTSLTVQNVLSALGMVDYDMMVDLTKSLLDVDTEGTIILINEVHKSGKDLKQFMKSYMDFVLDMNIFRVTGNAKFVSTPATYIGFLRKFAEHENFCHKLLQCVNGINNTIKWDSSPKASIIAELILFKPGGTQ